MDFGLLVFVPRLTCPGGPERLRELGLLEIFGPSQAWRHIERGPDGGPGLLLGHSGSTPAYEPEAQEWKPSHAPTLFFGWQAGAPPGPEFFARERQIAGHALELGTANCELRTANFWTVPCARYLDGSTALPCLLEQTPDGVVVGAIAPRYAAFAERAAWWFAFATERIGRGEPLVWDWDELAAFAAEALALNYRLTLPLALALGLLTDANVWEIVLATGDFPALQARSKIEDRKSKIEEEENVST